MPVSFATGLFWTSVACCVVAQLLIVRSVIGARHVPRPDTDLPRSHAGVELMWALVPAVALVALFVFTWRAVEAHETVRALVRTVTP
jgi:heme/copper-type cytochrome/quinol oxidase subunit 2